MAETYSGSYEYRSFYYDQMRKEPIVDDFVVPVGTEMTPELLKNLIEEHKETRVPRYLALKAVYETRYSIFDKDNYNTKPDYKPDNRLAADFAKYILDTFEGYYIGVPPQIKHKNEAQDKWLKGYIDRNYQEDVDADISEMCSKYGKAYELLYQDEDGNPRSAALTPISCFVVFDDSVLKRPLYGVRYYYNDEGKLQGSYSDDTTIYRFEDDGDITFDDGEDHYFGGVPIIQYVQNLDQRGIYEGVLNLIDAYNKALSEEANDVDYFADAYLAVLGQEIEDEQFKKDLREYRLINVWPGEAGGTVDVMFLAKPDGNVTQENLINRLETLIFKLSMVPDISNEAFGTASGIALKMRLQPMSNLARKKDRKFVASMKRRFELLANYPNLPFRDWQDVEIVMKRNMPEDLASEASLASSLSGITSKETQLGVLSFVDDPSAELERMEAEQNERAERLMNQTGSRGGVAKEPAMYQITSVLGQRKRGQLAYNNALRMMVRIGLSEEEARQLLDDTEEETA